jgi:hypothetical protein
MGMSDATVVLVPGNVEYEVFVNGTGGADDKVHATVTAILDSIRFTLVA